MGDRRNFLDADNSIIEKNLRFVQSDLEQNLNQYFSSSGSSSRGGGGRGSYDESPAISAPPRDYKVVQPNPGNRFGNNSSSNSSAYKPVKQQDDEYTSSSPNYYKSGQTFSHRQTPDNRQPQQQQRQQFADNNSSYYRNGNTTSNFHNSSLFKRRDELPPEHNEQFQRNNDTGNSQRYENTGIRSNERFAGGNQNQFERNEERRPPYTSNSEAYSGNYRDSWNNNRFENNSQQFGDNFSSRKQTQLGNTNGPERKRPYEAAAYTLTSQTGNYNKDSWINDRYENTSQQLGDSFSSRNQAQLENTNGPERRRPYGSNNDAAAHTLTPQSGNCNRDSRSNDRFENNSQYFVGNFDSGNQNNKEAASWERPQTSSNVDDVAYSGDCGSQSIIGSAKKRANFEMLPCASKKILKNKKEKSQTTATGVVSLGVRNRKKKKKDDKYKARRKNANMRNREARTLVAAGVLKKAPQGKSKAEPESYWREWWTKHGYIEKAIEKVDASDEAVKDFINFTYKPSDREFDARKKLLLHIGVGKINRSMNINEVTYEYRDVFKLFVYKKHLEDPNFQKYLTSPEKSLVEAALERLKNKVPLALLHQSLINRWHYFKTTLEQLGSANKFGVRNANKLFKDKLFIYLVLDSIRELKTITAQDWPEFDEFYNNL